MPLTQRRKDSEWAGCYAGFCPTAYAIWTAIYLGTTFPQPSSGLPESGAGSSIALCLTLLRTRFT